MDDTESSQGSSLNYKAIEGGGDGSVQINTKAVGALAYGTESGPKADKIVGPGNIFVAMAKREVFGVVGIDGIYGPTEAVVIADGSANPTLVAADLLAQAEHDLMAIPILTTNSQRTWPISVTSVTDSVALTF